MNILKIIYGMAIVALLSACTHIGVGVGFGSGNFGMGIGGTVPLPIKRPTQAVITPSTAVERELQIELAAVNQLRAGQGATAVSQPFFRCLCRRAGAGVGAALRS